ncbi:MAG: hypothetical protein IPI60_06190 [Saprospiraceae bacterium]|nr:hypothetical protein [Saprospiraceae bacterium]
MLELTVLPILTEQVIAEICAGASYEFNGSTITSGGVYTHQTVNANGCDSLVTLVLTLTPVLEETLNVEICEGATYSFNGSELFSSGTFVTMLNNADGCDSLVTLHLTVVPHVPEHIFAEICQGAVYMFNGSALTSPGMYGTELTTAEGCDSSVILHLTVTPAINTSLNVTICDGGSYDFFGSSVSQPGFLPAF